MRDTVAGACRCQSEFCVNHMAWVTHGKAPLGKCPLDARCICELCWAELEQHGQPLPVHGAGHTSTDALLACTLCAHPEAQAWRVGICGDQEVCYSRLRGMPAGWGPLSLLGLCWALA